MIPMYIALCHHQLVLLCIVLRISLSEVLLEMSSQKTQENGTVTEGCNSQESC